MKFFRSLTGAASIAAAAILPLASHAASAQDSQSAAAAKSSDVQNIGDWIVRCFPTKTPAPCAMYQQLYDKNSRQLVLAISFAYVPSVDRHEMQIIVPLGVAIAKGVVIQTSTFTSPALPYRHCDRSGCYVEMMIDNGSVESFGHADPAAKLKVVADDGKEYPLPFSLKGFADAHDAMINLAKQKASKPGDQAAAAPAPKK